MFHKQWPMLYSITLYS